MDELYDRVCERPWDRDLRAVWADSLAQAGDPLGEVLTLSMRLDDDPPDDPGRLANGRRRADLLARHGDRWRDRWLLRIPRVRAAWLGGFPDRLSVARGLPEILAYEGPEKILAGPDPGLAAVPVLGLSASAGPDKAGLLADLPLMSRIERLSVATSPVSASAAQRLLDAAPHLRDLALLVLDPEVFRVVARHPSSASLATLTLYGTGAGPGELAILAGSPHLRGLRGLHVQNRPGERAAVIAGASWRLRSLSLDGAGGIADLARMPELTSLSLRGAAIGVPEADALQRLGLASLSLWNCSLSAGASALLPLPKTLVVSGGSGFGALSRRIDAEGPSVLDLDPGFGSEGKIGRVDLHRLASAPWMASVEDLTIGHEDVDERLVRALAAPNLISLDFGRRDAHPHVPEGALVDLFRRCPRLQDVRGLRHVGGAASLRVFLSDPSSEIAVIRGDRPGKVDLLALAEEPRAADLREIRLEGLWPYSTIRTFDPEVGRAWAKSPHLAAVPKIAILDLDRKIENDFGDLRAAFGGRLDLQYAPLPETR